MNPAPYTRFVIIGAARSGTTFLQSLLKSHPDIVCLGEIFHLLSRRGHDLDAIVRDPIGYVSNTVYRSYPSQTRAVGYKTLYSQIDAESFFLRELDTSHVSPATKEKRDDFSAFMAATYDLAEVRARFASLADFIKSDRELRVIHIQRANKLEMFLSFRLAGLSGAWNSMAGPYLNESVFLDPAECERFFVSTEQRQKTFSEMFAGHPLLSVSYADLANDTETCMAVVQEFLEVPVARLSSPLKKQAQRSMAEAISNFAELKAHFCGTRWEQLFL